MNALIYALLALVVGSLPACAETPARQTYPATQLAPGSVRAPLQREPLPADSMQTNGHLSPLWQPLVSRLSADGLYGPDIEAALLQIGDVPSEDPMGRKITELYKRAFVPPPPRDPNAPKRPPQTVYKGVITDETIAKCRAFLDANAAAFAQSERLTTVPKEVAVSLLFVETRLGTFMGKAPAFLTLASMSATRNPEQIPTFLSNLPDTASHTDWITERMQKRSDWAYKELAAFIRFARAAGIDPMSVPGSIYGAIGLCQYMPSNLEPLGADGNGDGVVNLFQPEDAIASLTHYLRQHGWKPGLSRDKRIAVVKRYNNSFTYANTILTLAEAVERGTATPPAPPAKPAKAQRKPAKPGA